MTIADRVPEAPSTYLVDLPGIFAQDPFLGRFLRIFEALLDPIERSVGSLAYLFDTRLTPPDLLPWFAQWVGLALDERWPEAKRREVIREAVELYSWRGTRRGMIEMLRLYTGVEPTIEEPGLAGGAAATDAHHFRVEMKLPAGVTVDRDIAVAIIEVEKPAHTSYELLISTDATRERPSGGTAAQ